MRTASWGYVLGIWFRGVDHSTLCNVTIAHWMNGIMRTDRDVRMMWISDGLGFITKFLGLLYEEHIKWSWEFWVLGLFASGGKYVTYYHIINDQP